jgi:hypothetical protein
MASGPKGGAICLDALERRRARYPSTRHAFARPGQDDKSRA